MLAKEVLLDCTMQIVCYLYTRYFRTVGERMEYSSSDSESEESLCEKELKEDRWDKETIKRNIIKRNG